MRLFLCFFMCCFLLLNCGCGNEQVKTDAALNKTIVQDTGMAKSGGARKDANLSPRGD
jgi:hypothetical protein